MKIVLSQNSTIKIMKIKGFASENFKFDIVKQQLSLKALKEFKTQNIRGKLQRKTKFKV